MVSGRSKFPLEEQTVVTYDEDTCRELDGASVTIIDCEDFDRDEDKDEDERCCDTCWNAGCLACISRCREGVIQEGFVVLTNGARMELYSNKVLFIDKLGNTKRRQRIQRMSE